MPLDVSDVPGFFVDVSKSSYLAGVIVATGTPGNLTLLTCGPDTVAFENPGEPVYVLAFSHDAAVTGGQFVIEVKEGQPAPKLSMRVDDVGTVKKRTGAATVSGTYTCDGKAEFVEMSGWLSQEQGRGLGERRLQPAVVGVRGHIRLECGSHSGERKVHSGTGGNLRPDDRLR